MATLAVLVAVSLLMSACAKGRSDPVTDITATSATLHGAAFNDHHGATPYWFRYGTTTAYGRETPRRSLAIDDNQYHAVSESIGGLTPETTYHASFCAGDPALPTYAWCDADRTFTTAPADPACASPANAIVAENCKTGSPKSEWDVQGAGDPSIQGFATDISVGRGTPVEFKVKTDASAYRLDIYRMGYYGGDGARKVATVQPSASLPQSQPDCLTDDASGLVDCGNWTVSARWDVPADAASGIYFAKLVREDGTPGASHIVFVVRDDAGASKLLFQTSDTTWQAYNRYGGNSLYTGAPGTNPGRAYKVSYNRPFTNRSTTPEDWVFNSEYPMVRWLERNGYDVSYATGLDSARSGARIRDHRAFLSVGHDEYWSGAQRANVQAARDAGVNLAFFSGNESFWKTRWEPSIDASRTADRTLVSYKETHADAKIDPTSVWTGTWRDPRSFNPDGASPENALSGTIFTVNSGTAPIQVPSEDGRLRLWRGTNIANLPAGATATLADGTLGYEWDEDLDNGARPPGLVRLSTTTVTGVEKLQDYGSTYATGTATHHLTLYRHHTPGGPDALVFGAGTIQWPWGLDDHHDRGAGATDERMQQATVNLLADMNVQPGGLQPGLAPATASNDNTAPTSTITSPANGAGVEQGTPVTIAGTASDGGGGVVGGVEVSVDGGSTWHPATGRDGWSFTWTPTQQGQTTIRSRATDDSGNLETPSGGVSVGVGPPAAPSCPCTIFPDTAAPLEQPAANDGQPIEVGVKFRADEDGFITGLRFYKGPGTTGTHIGHLWSASGSQLAEATFTAESGSGWQQVRLPSPVAVTKDTTYVASYHSSAGYYAFDGGFLGAGVDNPPLHALADGVAGGNGVYRYGASGFPTSSFNASNYWADAVFERSVGPDTTAPTVTAVAPADGAADVDPGTRVTATFDEAIDPSTLTGGSFELRGPGGGLVAADVSYDASTRRAVLAPHSALANSTTYTTTIKGGAGGVADPSGNVLAQNRTWSFTTADPTPSPPGDGPGGPILVATSSGDPFGRYYGEILRAEGLNEYAVKDLSQLSAQSLAAYDVVVLAQTSLSDAEASMLNDWVQGGGNLIAMRPDAKLAGLLGVQPASGTLGDAYLKVDTASTPGAGITGATMQFHGAADRYDLQGARSVADLYSDASTATANPAVTVHDVGASGGQAAAFTYDLARSVVYTRQGNPAWAGDRRDGQSGPIRSDDLFFGAKAGDAKPDWVDLGKVAIPQADEQQRLLANLIAEMERDRSPLPRFWYLPRGERAAVILTGDDHGSGGTAGQFDRYKADSSAGCSVADWQCVRSTSYVYPNTPLTDAQVAAYQADGFEIALHVDTGCADFTRSSLEANFTDQLAAFAATWPSLAAPRTNRTHCIAWSDWSSHPEVEHAHGVRLDTNYYYWPDAWVQDRPGMFTGSGFPMRFAALDGSLIDVYQATTQMTDESGIDIPRHIAALLDGALGPQGYYGAFTANMHTDQGDHAGANAIVAAAQARGVPVISARQMLTWLDGRNASSFQNMSFAAAKLNFTVAPGAGARGLEAMVPTASASGPLTGITRGGQAVNTTTRTIKGVEYAFFAAAAGDYVATYGGDTTAPVISGRAAVARADGTATVTWHTDEPASSRVLYGTSPGALTGDQSDPSRVTDHSLDLTGLTPGTTYHFRVSSTDGAGNTAESPDAAAAPDSFGVPASVVDTTIGDFTAGTPGADTSVGASGSGADGEVQLRPTVGEEFDGTGLPAGWSVTPWGAGGTGEVSGGALAVNGARAGTDAAFAPSRTVEFVATFAAAPFQHVGFGVDYNDAPWAMFSTGGGSLPVGLYARTNGASQQNTEIQGVSPTVPHRYRIAWTASGVEYFVDGVSVATHPIGIGSDMRPLASDFDTAGGGVSVDWLRMSPYAATGSFTSRVLDAGQAGARWSTAELAASSPPGTQLQIETRTGEASDPGAGGWSGWQPLGAGGAVASPDGRYIQYRASLGGNDDAVTPTLQRVEIGYRPPTP